jgi:hypothetical protein
MWFCHNDLHFGFNYRNYWLQREEMLDVSISVEKRRGFRVFRLLAPPRIALDLSFAPEFQACLRSDPGRPLLG